MNNGVIIFLVILIILLGGGFFIGSSSVTSQAVKSPTCQWVNEPITECSEHDLFFAVTDTQKSERCSSSAGFIFTKCVEKTLDYSFKLVNNDETEGMWSYRLDCIVGGNKLEGKTYTFFISPHSEQKFSWSIEYAPTLSIGCYPTSTNVPTKKECRTIYKPVWKCTT